MFWHVFLAVIYMLATAETASPYSFPGTGEFDIVFPRNNETYAVVSPFPVILGFHGDFYLELLSTSLNWRIDCTHSIFHGSDYRNGNRGETPELPYYRFGSFKAYGDVGEPSHSFGWWVGPTESCKLSWDFRFYQDCRVNETGGMEYNFIKEGGAGTVYGSVNFTLALDGVVPHDAISEYGGCPNAGVAATVQERHGGCPNLGSSSITQPKPCDINIKEVASSLAKAVPTPTTRLTESPASTSMFSTSTVDPSTSANGTGDNNGNSGADLRFDLGFLIFFMLASMITLLL